MTPPSTPSAPKPSPPGVDDGTCELFGPAALIVQGLMGVMVVLTLVYKRHREKPKRKWRIWMFDVSKQLIGQIVVHFANVFISAIGGEQTVQNPCVLYFLNIVVDTTVGVGILYLLLWGATKILTEHLQIRGLQSGQYGDGPKPSPVFWARQAAVYVACLLGMKVAVIILFAVWPGIFAIGEWILSWIGNSDWAQVVFVMGICPILFNMLQFWLIDSIVKARDSLNLGLSTPDAVDEAQAPLFTDERRDSDSDSEPRNIRSPRRRLSPDLERGLSVSPRKPSPATSTEHIGTKEATSHDATTTTETKPGSTNSPKTIEAMTLPAVPRRSPPPSPAHGATAAKDTDDDWNAWEDDVDWDTAPKDAWDQTPASKDKGKTKSRSSTLSPRGEPRRLSLSMDVISSQGGSSTGAVR
ncbi:hypothetical protein FRC14_005923 [Serendipita sp. 396]|nr:hypothetical protein FRC14_005923 [Serendipita sp. 396]KAG8787027.1 hypothetical protein FRC15_010188 [Serendipita sp. 397]KAG8871361.1 hypothetical protein FRC20_010618 [Serendipita sp. 405]KAG9055113.1 hypothetical protein FS842_003118 [Serendipita sp. 407]